MAMIKSFEGMTLGTGEGTCQIEMCLVTDGN